MPVGLVFILCTAPFLSVHGYYRLLPFAPLLPLHALGHSPCCDITQPELAPIWKKKIAKITTKKHTT